MTLRRSECIQRNVLQTTESWATQRKKITKIHDSDSTSILGRLVLTQWKHRLCAKFCSTNSPQNFNTYSVWTGSEVSFLSARSMALSFSLISVVNFSVFELANWLTTLGRFGHETKFYISDRSWSCCLFGLSYMYRSSENYSTQHLKHTKK